MALSANAANLVLNPGFESNGGVATTTATSWTINGGNAVIVSDNGPSAPGTFALNINTTASFSIVVQSADFSLVPSTTYNFLYDLKVGDLGNSRQLYIAIGNSFGGNYGSSSVITPSTSPYSDLAWHTDGFQFTTPASGVGAGRVLLYLDGGGGNANFVADNFSVDAVPEPGTAMLASLGLGASLCARRRRNA